MSFHEDQVIALHQWLQEKHELGGFDSLSDTEKSIWVIEELQVEVNNGGFHQYFFNSAGNHASLLTVALEEVGAQEIRDLCRGAMSLFPGGRPADDRFTRQVQLEEAERMLGVDIVEQRLGELDERFYPLQEDLHRKLYDFAVRNALLR